MPKLEIFQSLWAMELRDPERPERTPEESFAMVADAGYHGMAIDLGATDIEAARAVMPLYEKHGLRGFFNAFPQSIEGLQPVLDMSRDLDAPFVNMIGQVMPITVADSVPVIRDWLALGEAAGMPLLFETHRNCITNDLFATLQLLDLVPEMRLCADLSHFVVDREFPFPVSDENHALIHRVLERADSFQGRVATREQVQVPVLFSQHQGWFDTFKGWWEEGLRLWRKRAGPDDTVIFLCELGPREYAITGPDNRELSDRWEDALVIRTAVEDIWAKLEAEDAA